jgi:hypothetical protein
VKGPGNPAHAIWEASTMENDRASGSQRAALPRFDEAPDAQLPTDAWRATRARDGGVGRARRASNWTAAALIAGVAVTTGYLAHNVPATSTTSSTTGTATQPGTSAHGAHSGPAVHSAVATSGGSGAVGGSGGGGGTAGTSGTSWRDN